MTWDCQKRSYYQICGSSSLLAMTPQVLTSFDFDISKKSFNTIASFWSKMFFFSFLRNLSRMDFAIFIMLSWHPGVTSNYYFISQRKCWWPLWFFLQSGEGTRRSDQCDRTERDANGCGHWRWESSVSLCCHKGTHLFHFNTKQKRIIYCFQIFLLPFSGSPPPSATCSQFAHPQCSVWHRIGRISNSNEYDGLSHDDWGGGFFEQDSFQVSVAIAAINRDPRSWGDDSLSFRPERFIENPKAPNPFKWMPFSAGNLFETFYLCFKCGKK